MSLPPPDPSRASWSELPPPEPGRPAPPPFPGEPAGAAPAGAAPPDPGSYPDPGLDPGPDGGPDAPPVLTPDEVIAAPSPADPGEEPTPPADPVATDAARPDGGTPGGPPPPASDAPAPLPAAMPSRSLVPVTRPDEPATEPPAPSGLRRRWSMPVWGWLLLGAVVVAGAVIAVVTRPDDDTKEVASLQEQVLAKDAELLQAQADAQQQAFDDVQEVRNEAEEQLSAAASAREQAEQSAAQADARYQAFVDAEVVRVQSAAEKQGCADADVAGYAQAPKPDPATFAPAEVAHLPADTAAEILARIDVAPISAQVELCYQTGSDRYLSQTTTTTTLPPDPIIDPNVPPVDAGVPAG